MTFPGKRLFMASCALALYVSQTQALPFNSIDPRSFAMGGTGVASGTSANAGFVNPALLGAARKGDRFSLELPIVGLRVLSEDNVIDELNNLQDNNLQSLLETQIRQFNSNPGVNTAQAVGTAAATLQQQLAKLSNKALQGELLGGTIIGIPGRSFGASLNIGARAIVGGHLNITSQDNQLLTDIQSVANNPALLLTNTTVNQVLTGQNLDQILSSNLEARGAAIGELGVSLAREFTIMGEAVSIGLTPKIIRVMTFDYVADVNTASFSKKNGEVDYTDFNLDLGIAKEFARHWKAGLTIKDLITNNYQTIRGNFIRIEPQARIGIAYDKDWLTLAMDADLTENAPIGLESFNSQIVALGAEVDLWDTLQLRLGYHTNVSQSGSSGTPTIGLGLSPFGVHIDLAAEYSENNGDKQAGGSLQFGFRF